MTKKIIHPDDSDLFRQAIGDVRAIKSDKVQFKKEPIKRHLKPKTSVLTEAAFSGSPLAIETVSHEETLSFAVPGIQHAVLARLRKGFFGLQAELDLHGLNGLAAKQQLQQFLNFSVSAGYRCVHIIHGKGYRSTEQVPVLKNHINQWLRQHKDVLAFCSASPRNGGAGAVYVLLRLGKDHPDMHD